MSVLAKNSKKRVKLFIPGPVEVRPKILEAQVDWMYGHRMPECLELIRQISPKLRQVFRTNSRALIAASSGSGFWEGAIRNVVHDEERVLNCVNGAFADRWRLVTELNGKQNDVLAAEWGKPITPEMVAERLAGGGYGAITVVHNETSAGVENPIQEIAQAVRAAPSGDEMMILVDSVSGLSGARLEFDDWDLDAVLCSSQKAFALPPGLAFCAVSDRAMAKAATVTNRGYYFDFITLDKSLQKDQTPATPAISLLWALDKQLDDMLAEGIEARWARHITMRDMTLSWAKNAGFESFAEPGYESPTVSCIKNNLGLDISDMNGYLRQRGMVLSNGYGASLKDKTFRIAHMGDLRPADMEELFAGIDGYLAQRGSA